MVSARKVRTTYGNTVEEAFDELVADDANVGALLPLLPPIPLWLLFVVVLLLLPPPPILPFTQALLLLLLPLVVVLLLLLLFVLLLLLLLLLPPPPVLRPPILASLTMLALPPPVVNEEAGFVLVELEEELVEVVAFDGELEGDRNGVFNWPGLKTDVGKNARRLPGGPKMLFSAFDLLSATKNENTKA